MRPKSIILLVLALGCGLVASIGINQVLANRGQIVVTEPGEVTPIYVALNDMNQGEQITPDKVKLHDWPKTQVPLGALTRLEDVEGRVTRTRFVANEPILDGKLYAKGDKGAGATPLIPRGMRVVSVRVDAEKGASGMILPGDSVDVLVHVAENPARGISRSTTKTILQNVTVFAVDNIYDRGNNGETTIAAKTVSLLVSPDYAELLTLAAEMGTIRLIMRGNNDDEIVETTGKDHSALSSNAAASKLPSGSPGPSPADMTDLIRDLDRMRQAHSEEPRPAKSGWKMVVLDGDEFREIEVQDANLGRGRLAPHLQSSQGFDPGAPLTLPGISDDSPTAFDREE